MSPELSLGITQIITGIAIITGRQAINGASPDDAKKAWYLRKTTWAGLGLIVTGIATIVAGATGATATAVQ